MVNRIRHGSLRSGAHSHASDIEHIGHRPNLVQGAGELGRTLQLDPQIDAGRFGRAGAHAGITHIDAVVLQPHQDVLEHADPIEHLDAQLHRVTALLGLAGRIPMHRQAAGHRDLLDIAAILTVNGNAVIAKLHRTHNRLTRQGAATAA